MSAAGQAWGGWRGVQAPPLSRHLDGHDATPVASQLLTWALMVPLLIFAVHSGFSFEHGSWNNSLDAVGGRIAVATSSAETAVERGQAWVAYAICVAAMFPYYRSILRTCLQMRAMTALSLLAMLSALWSQDGWMSLRSGVYLLLCTLFAFYLTIRFRDTEQMDLLVLTGGAVVALSFATALFWPQFGVDHQAHEGAWQGIFTQKNVCAEATLFLLTPAVSMGGRQGALLWRWAYIGAALLLIALTQSRTGWAITGIYLLFAMVLRMLGRFARRDMVPIAALLAAATGAAAVALLEYWRVILAAVSRGGGFSGRAEIWSAVMHSVLQRPIGGWGFDAFWSLPQGEASSIFLATGWVVTSAHNGFLNVALELGAVGFVLVAVTFVGACRDAVAVFRPGRRSYVDWCIGVVFLTVVYNMDERTLMATHYLPWMLYIVACTGLAAEARRVRMGLAEVAD